MLATCMAIALVCLIGVRGSHTSSKPSIMAALCHPVCKCPPSIFEPPGNLLDLSLFTSIRTLNVALHLIALMMVQRILNSVQAAAEEVNPSVGLQWHPAATHRI